MRRPHEKWIVQVYWEVSIEYFLCYIVVTAEYYSASEQGRQCTDDDEGNNKGSQDRPVFVVSSDLLGLKNVEKSVNATTKTQTF